MFKCLFDGDKLNDIEPFLKHQDYSRICEIRNSLCQIAEKENNAKSSKEKDNELAKNHFLIAVHALYPFCYFRLVRKGCVLVKKTLDGECLFADNIDFISRAPYFLDDNNEETLAKMVARSKFLSKEEFEKKIIGPEIGIPGEIFAAIPREERFKITAHYEKPRVEQCGIITTKHGDVTRLANVDLLTGGGTYNSGEQKSNLQKDVEAAIKAKTFEELVLANQSFNFFYKSKTEQFVPIDDVPLHWMNVNDGNQIEGMEEHTLDYWREQLLKKYGFDNVDFSKADIGKKDK